MARALRDVMARTLKDAMARALQQVMARSRGEVMAWSLAGQPNFWSRTLWDLVNPSLTPRLPKLMAR